MEQVISDPWQIALVLWILLRNLVWNNALLTDHSLVGMKDNQW